jgi:hypothetical protein
MIPKEGEASVICDRELEDILKMSNGARRQLGREATAFHRWGLSITASPSARRILIHLIYSTKNRERVLGDGIRDELHKYREFLERHEIKYDERYVWD